MRKGEIACNKQFLLLSQFFLPYMALISHFKCTLKCHFNLDQSKILSSGYGFTLYHTIPTLNDLVKKSFEKIMGIGENAGSWHFLLFHQWVLPIPKRISVFKLHCLCCLQMILVWTFLKICCLVKR